MHTRENMLDYVINLLEETQEFSWSSAKACHAVLLCRMEQGEVKSWNETEKIEFGGHMPSEMLQLHTVPRGILIKQPMPKPPLVYFNKGSCSQKQSHQTKGVFHKHVCSSYWVKDGKAFLILRVMVGSISQKTSKQGHSPGWACP